MTAFATMHDVEAAWRPLTAAQLLIIDSRLDYVSAIIRARVIGVDARIAAGTLDSELVKHVTVDVVLRNLKNPEGKSQEQIEDYRYVRDKTTSSGQLFLTDQEVDLLSRRPHRAFSIVPGQAQPDYATTERVALLQDQWSHWPPTGNGTDAC